MNSRKPIWLHFTRKSYTRIKRAIFTSFSFFSLHISLRFAWLLSDIWCAQITSLSMNLASYTLNANAYQLNSLISSMVRLGIHFCTAISVFQAQSLLNHLPTVCRDVGLVLIARRIWLNNCREINAMQLG